MSRRRDATLAAVVLVPVFTVGGPLDPIAAGAGAVGALTLEVAFSRRRTLVRRVWERRIVQALAVVGTLVCGAVLTRVVGGQVPSVLAGGLVAYLALLGALSVRDRV